MVFMPLATTITVPTGPLTKFAPSQSRVSTEPDPCFVSSQREQFCALFKPFGCNRIFLYACNFIKQYAQHTSSPVGVLELQAVHDACSKWLLSSKGR